MIDPIHEKLMSYALGEGDPAWRREIESLILNDESHQKAWNDLLPSRQAIEMTQASESADVPRNLGRRAALLVECSKRAIPPTRTAKGRRDFLQDVFAARNVPLPGGVPLRGTVWKDVTPYQTSGGSTRPTPRSRHEKSVASRVHAVGSVPRVAGARKRPVVALPVASAPSGTRALDAIVLGGLFMFWAPLIVLAVAVNHHGSLFDSNGGSLYPVNQEFLAVEPAAFRTSSLPKIEVDSLQAVGRSDKTFSSDYAYDYCFLPVRSSSTSSEEAIEPLPLAKQPPALKDFDSSGYPPSSRFSPPVRLSPRSGVSPYDDASRTPDSLNERRYSFRTEPGRLFLFSGSSKQQMRLESGAPIFFLGGSR